MSKVIMLADLYRKSVQEYTKSPDEWKGLLSCVARFYKHSFDNAVLIYAQKPNATQLGTWNDWHDERIGRNINKGAKSIAVIDMQNPGTSLKNLFDFMDTNGTEESFKNFMRYRWELEEQYYPSLMIRFHKKYDVPTSCMEECLNSLIHRRVAEILPKYMEYFKVREENSVLFGMPEEAVKEEFMELVTDSVVYTVFSKCGMPTESIGKASFENISRYNTLEMFMSLGNCTVSLARPMLKEIQKEIEAIKSERSIIYENRTIDEYQLQARGRRGNVPRIANLRGSGQNIHGQIRGALEEIHDGKLSTPLVRVGGIGRGKQNLPESGGRSATSQREANSTAFGKSSDAGNREYAGESRIYEQPDTAGRRNRPERTGTESQVEFQDTNYIELPTVDYKPSVGSFFVVSTTSQSKPETNQHYMPPQDMERQVLTPASELLDDYSAADDIEKISDVGLLADESLIADFLRGGPGVRGGKLHIYQAVKGIQAKKERLKVIKDEYGWYGFINGERRLDAIPGKGITLKYSENGTILRRQLSWPEVEKRITELVHQGSYLTENEKEELEGLEELHFTEEELQAEIIPTTLPEARQIMLFDVLKQQDIYEDTSGSDEDGILNVNNIPLEAVSAQQEENPSREEADILHATSQVNRANNADDIIANGIQSHIHRQGFNYHYSQEHNLYDGGAKTKCRNNIAAIRLLKELQAQRNEMGKVGMATAEEQVTLARFVGWGGLANALTPGKPGWESEYEEIKSLLTEEEFQSAQESTITAYYTSQEVICHIYRALEQFGFRGGNILDPAMGTGNFFSVLPENMEHSKLYGGVETKLYGIELDTISGEIARQLYPEAEIQVKGFEKTNYPDHFFDVVIGNIPFNSIRVDDPRYNRHAFRIHDYFLAKSLDLVRPGGIVAVITSKYTLDKANSKVRRYLAQQAELLGAIRLPNNAFKAVAGTEATADILFLQKREREIVPDEENSPWISIEENRDGIPLNTYFIEHPEMVLGEMVFDESMFGNEKTTACHPVPGDDLNERLERAVSYLEGEYHEAASEYAGEKGATEDSLPANPAVRNFSYTMVRDALYF